MAYKGLAVIDEYREKGQVYMERAIGLGGYTEFGYPAPLSVVSFTIPEGPIRFIPMVGSLSSEGDSLPGVGNGTVDVRGTLYGWNYNYPSILGISSRGQKCYGANRLTFPNTQFKGNITAYDYIFNYFSIGYPLGREYELVHEVKIYNYDTSSYVSVPAGTTVKTYNYSDGVNWYSGIVFGNYISLNRFRNFIGQESWSPSKVSVPWLFLRRSETHHLQKGSYSYSDLLSSIKQYVPNGGYRFIRPYRRNTSLVGDWAWRYGNYGLTAIGYTSTESSGRTTESITFYCTYIGETTYDTEYSWSEKLYEKNRTGFFISDKENSFEITGEVVFDYDFDFV